MRDESGFFEALIVDQAYARRLSSFTMDDFRGDLLPNFDPPDNLNYRKYFRIEKHGPRDYCPWACSRWITGENGKLVYLDDDYDTSG